MQGLPSQRTGTVQGSKVDPDLVLCGGSGDLQHPRGRIEARRQGRNPRNALKVGNKIRGLGTQRPMENDFSADFHEEQIVEGLHQGDSFSINDGPKDAREKCRPDAALHISTNEFNNTSTPCSGGGVAATHAGAPKDRNPMA